MNENELLERAMRGDRTATTDLLATVGPDVRRVVDAERPQRYQALLSTDDVLQQTYADAFLGIERFVPRGEGAFRAWVTRLARRNLIDAIRMLSAEKRGGGKRKIEGGVRDESYVELFDLLQRTLSTPSRKLAKKEARLSLEQALAKLPPHYAQVVRMYDLEGQPIEVVAEGLQKSVGAAYMLRSRAHDRLGELMGSASRFFSTG